MPHFILARPKGINRVKSMLYRHTLWSLEVRLVCEGECAAVKLSLPSVSRPALPTCTDDIPETSPSGDSSLTETKKVAIAPIEVTFYLRMWCL